MFPGQRHAGYPPSPSAADRDGLLWPVRLLSRLVRARRPVQQLRSQLFHLVPHALQNRLQLDLGVPGSGVTVNTRQASEVTQKVFRWATGRGLSAGLDETPMGTPLADSTLGSMVFGPGGFLPYTEPASGPTSAPGVSPSNRWQGRR